MPLRAPPFPVEGSLAASEVVNDSSVPGASVKDALNALLGGAGSAVSSVFGRVGAVVAVVGDYTSSLVSNSSTVAGATVTAALDALKTAASAPGYYRANAGTNTFGTNGNRNFQYATGSAFAEIFAGTGLTFTASACQVKNTSGATKNYLVRVYASVFQSASSPGLVFLYVDNNGDLQGSSVVAAGLNYVCETFVDASGDESIAVIETKISVVNNGIIRPILGASDQAGANPIGSDIGVDQFAMIVQEVP